MRKLLMVLCIGCASGPSSAQLITYLDATGYPLMYSSRVGKQVVIMDKYARPTAFMPILDGSLPTTKTTKDIDPLILPKSALSNDKSLPSLPSLPTISNGLFD